MPFDVAFDLIDGGPENEVEAFAMHVIFGQMNGAEFDWESHSWKKPD